MLALVTWRLATLSAALDRTPARCGTHVLCGVCAAAEGRRVLAMGKRFYDRDQAWYLVQPIQKIAWNHIFDMSTRELDVVVWRLTVSAEFVAPFRARMLPRALDPFARFGTFDASVIVSSVVTN